MADPVPAPSLLARGLAVNYSSVRAVDGVDLEVGQGEIVALLGPSGSGKTTLLHAVAGFVAPSEGSIWIGGREVSGPGWATPPERRSVGLVFQSYALWPHMTAVETVAYPLRRLGQSDKMARASALGLLERVGLAAMAERRPHQLSGGEQQRVGLARALAGSPSLFLLDEPTANLDAALKPALQRQIVEQQRTTGAGALYVTHDPSEAFAVAQRVAVLRLGRLLQVADPITIYADPVDAWVASLTGPSSVVAVSGSSCLPDGRIQLGIAGTTISCRGSVRSGAGPGWAVIRPEWCSLAEPGELPLEACIALARFQGGFTDYLLRGAGYQVTVRGSGSPVHSLGDTVSWRPERVVLVEEDGSTAE